MFCWNKYEIFYQFAPLNRSVSIVSWNSIAVFPVLAFALAFACLLLSFTNIGDGGGGGGSGEVMCVCVCALKYMRLHKRTSKVLNKFCAQATKLQSSHIFSFSFFIHNLSFTSTYELTKGKAKKNAVSMPCDVRLMWLLCLAVFCFCASSFFFCTLSCSTAPKMRAEKYPNVLSRQRQKFN